MPSRVFALLSWLIPLMLLAAPASAQWTPAGVPLCDDSCVVDHPLIISDGAGGVFVGWRDSRATENGGAATDVFAQHLTGAGTIVPGWSALGYPVCISSGDQNLQSMAPDGQGGVLFAWQDGRVPGSSLVFAQRVMANGMIPPGWPVNGVATTLGPDVHDFATVAPDGIGGAFVAWEDEVDVGFQASYHAFVQHLTSAGAVSPGWPANGLPLCNLPTDSSSPYEVLPDGTGGAVVSWRDDRSGGSDVYAQHLLSDGSVAPGWTANGSIVVPGRTKGRLVADGAGGFYVACSTNEFPGNDLQLFVQRFTFAGARAAGWPDSGITVCDAPSIRGLTSFAPDDMGGALLAWQDYRSGPIEIYALRVMPDGSIAPGWAVNGTLISSLIGTDNEFEARIVGDGTGGAYVTWQEDNYEVFTGEFSHVQHLTANGAVAPGWPAHGVIVASTNDQEEPQIAEDGSGGAIIAWHARLHAYAQRFEVDGPVATSVALVSADAGPDRVALLWESASAQGLVATVYRRTETSAWQALGAPTLQAPDRLSFVDQTVVAGTRYAYRLGYVDGGAEQFTAETWVDVPKLAVFALEGARPNPAVRTLNVSLSLRDESPATLSVLDVAGRAVLSREVGSLGAGCHTVALDLGANAAPGIYWLRLTQSGRALLARAAVIR